MGEPARVSGQPLRGVDAPQPQIVYPTGSSMYKPQICRNFMRTGQCPYGENCIHAHVSTDGRTNPLQWQKPVGNGKMERNWNVVNETTYKRRVCRFFSKGRCPYGNSCKFAHQQPEKPEENLNVHSGSSVISIPTAHSDSIANPWLKTRLCNNWTMSNSCNYGANCIYAHGQAELKRPPASLGSEFANTQVASSTWKKNTIPYNVGEQTDEQKVPLSIYNRKTVNKIDGIYGDWIEG